MKKLELNEIRSLVLEGSFTPEPMRPSLKLIKSYPGMKEKVGTIFKYDPSWPGYTANRNYSSDWKWEEWKPYIGTFFKIIKSKK